MIKVYNETQDILQEASSCVRVCPQSAITVNGYKDVPTGKQARPMRSTDSIMWEIKFKNGACKKFKTDAKMSVERMVADWIANDLPSI